MIRKFPIPRWLLFLFILSACGRGGSDPSVLGVAETHPLHQTKNVPVGIPIQATFSSPVDPATVNEKTFIVGGILGKVTYQDQTATFTPAAETPLEKGREYHAILTTGIKRLDGIPLRSNLTWSFVTEEGPDTTRPRIISISPAAAEKEVPTRAPILVAFSEPMDVASIAHRDHFFIKGNIEGEYTYDPKTFTAAFYPSRELAPATTYQVNVAGVKDLAGNPILEDAAWSFTTRSGADTDPPKLEEKIPGNTETGVATNARVQVQFNEGIDPDSLTSRFLLIDRNAKVVATDPVAYDLSSRSALLGTGEGLQGGAAYQVIVKAGVADLSGNRTSSDVSWYFTTGLRPDAEPPSVLKHVPQDEGAVPVKSAITVRFSEPVDAGTIAGNFKLLKAGHADPVQGAVTYDAASMTARFSPSAPRLDYDSAYTAFLADGVQDLAGNRMMGNFSWTFATVPPPQIEGRSPEGEAVPVGEPITVLFSQAMDPASIDVESLTVAPLSPTGQPMEKAPGEVVYNADRRTATYAPKIPFSYDTRYQVTLTTRITDADANPLESPFTWTFKTEGRTTPPQVVSLSPADGAREVPVFLVQLSALFDQEIDPASLSGRLSLKEAGGGCCLAGALDYRLGEQRAVFSLTQRPLRYGTSYIATLAAGIRSTSGMSTASDIVWTFTTEAEPDTRSPGIQSALPADGAAGVPIDSAVQILFTEPITPGSANPATFQLQLIGAEGEEPKVVPGKYQVDSAAAVFTPNDPLIPGKLYRVTVTTEVSDLARNPLDRLYRFSFTTAP